MIAPYLSTQIDDHSVGLFKALSALLVLDDVDDRCRNANFQRDRFVRSPFKLVVHFPRSREKCDFPNARRKAGVIAKIFTEDGQLMGRPGAMELDTRRPLQASNVCARRRAAVEGLLAVFVQILAAGQGKAKARARRSRM